MAGGSGVGPGGRLDGCRKTGPVTGGAMGVDYLNKVLKTTSPEAVEDDLLDRRNTNGGQTCSTGAVTSTRVAGRNASWASAEKNR